MSPLPNKQKTTNNMVMLHPTSSVPKNVKSNASTLVCAPDAIALKDKNYYAQISYRCLRKLEKFVNIGGEPSKKRKNKKYVASPLSHCILSRVLLRFPKVGGKALASIISLSVTSFLANCDVILLLPNVPFACPSRNTLKQLLVEEVADSILLKRHEMAGKPGGIMCDKGEGESHCNGASVGKTSNQR